MAFVRRSVVKLIQQVFNKPKPNAKIQIRRIHHTKVNKQSLNKSQTRKYSPSMRRLLYKPHLSLLRNCQSIRYQQNLAIQPYSSNYYQFSARKYYVQSGMPYSTIPSVRSTGSSSSHGDTMLQESAAKPATLLSLKEICEYSEPENQQEFANFIVRELPIRISHRVIELGNLPYGLSNSPSIRQLRDLYTHSFHLFRLLPMPTNQEETERFARAINDHFIALKSATELLAAGITECIEASPGQADIIQQCPFLNSFLDKFHAARIGTRLLTGQFIALHSENIKNTKKQQQNSNKSSNKLNTKIGLIDPKLRVRETLEMAQDDAARLCYSNFGKCPEVNIEDEDNLRFTYVSSDLHYILFELMKNSMRAVCEYHYDLNEDDLPEINVVIIRSLDDNEVIIKICDEGGGIPADDISKIFLYSFTKQQKIKINKNGKKNNINGKKNTLSTIPNMNAIKTSMKDDINLNDLGEDSGEDETDLESRPLSHIDTIPMSGFGYGLPLSRLYARYFGGDLEIMSMDGFGTDAFVYLKYLNLSDTDTLQLQNAPDKVSHFSPTAPSAGSAMPFGA